MALLFLLFLLFLFFMQHVRWALCKNVAPPAPLLPPSSGGGHTTARPRPGGAFPEWRFLPLRTNRFLTSDAKEVLRTKQINPPFPSNSSCSRFSFSSNFSFPFCFNSSDMISIRFSFFPLTISFFFYLVIHFFEFHSPQDAIRRGFSQETSRLAHKSLDN